MEGRTAYGQHMTVFWSRAKHHVTTSLMTIMLACQTMLPQNSLWNKCIGDDTKAAAHQSLNRIKKIKDGEKWFLIWRIEFLHPSMWHVALKSWQWIHQVVAPCNVICGSGMTCHWIRPVAAPCNVTRSSEIITLNSPGGSTLALCSMTGGSGMTCHWIRPNVRSQPSWILGVPQWVLWKAHIRLPIPRQWTP